MQVTVVGRRNTASVSAAHIRSCVRCVVTHMSGDPSEAERLRVPTADEALGDLPGAAQLVGRAWVQIPALSTLGH